MASTFVTACVIRVAPSQGDQIKWCQVDVKKKKKEKGIISQCNCSTPPCMRIGPGASSGLGWRKPKGKTSISLFLVPYHTPPSHSIYHHAAGLSLGSVQHENDLLSGKAFLSVMLVTNYLI